MFNNHHNFQGFHGQKFVPSRSCQFIRKSDHILNHPLYTLNAFTNTFEIYISQYGKSFHEIDFFVKIGICPFPNANVFYGIKTKVWKISIIVELNKLNGQQTKINGLVTIFEEILYFLQKTSFVPSRTFSWNLLVLTYFEKRAQTKKTPEKVTLWSRWSEIKILVQSRSYKIGILNVLVKSSGKGHFN